MDLTSDMPVYKKRRYSKPQVATSIARKLRSKGYRYSSYPKYRQVSSYAKIYTFERICNINVTIHDQFGFSNGSGAYSNHLGLNFQLAGMGLYVGGSYVLTSAIPSQSEFQALFDRYRIDKVEVTPIWSCNYTGNNTSTITTPLLHQALDFDTVDGTNSLFEYPQCKTLQLGSINNGLTKFICYPCVTSAVSQIDTSTGTVSASLAESSKHPWLDAGAPNIQHFGMRFQYDSMGSTYNNNSGTIQFICRFYFSFKNSR